MANRVQQVFSRGYTVGQLVAEFECLPADTPVVFVCSFGDRSRTQQALPVSDILHTSLCEFKESGYSDSGVAFYEGGDIGESSGDGLDHVVVLRA